MKKNLNVILAYSIMVGLIVLVRIFQSWNVALSIFNMCLISAVMTMGANIQWGYAGLINFGIMGYTALRWTSCCTCNICCPSSRSLAELGDSILSCVCG